MFLGSSASLFEASQSVYQTSIKASCPQLSLSYLSLLFSLLGALCLQTQQNSPGSLLKSSPSSNKHPSQQMANALEDRDFRLFFEFLSNDDMLVDTENFSKNGFCFPSDSLGSSSVLTSPVESVVGSTETESDEEDRELLSGLTRQLAHSTLQETQKITCNSQPIKSPDSPESTLSSVGSWSSRSAVSSNGSLNSPSQGSSPSSAAIEPWDLIYAVKARGLLGDPRALTPTSVKDPTTGLYSNHSLTQYFSETSHFDKVREDQVLKQHYSSSIWGRPAKEGFLQQQMSSQSGWYPVSSQHQNQHCRSSMRGVFLGGSGVKRKCAGTGVFLPRRYASPSDPSNKTGCSTAPLPDRVVHTLNNTLPQPHFNTTFTSGYDALRGRRNAILTQQKRSLGPERAVNHEVHLPPEWTY